MGPLGGAVEHGLEGLLRVGRVRLRLRLAAEEVVAVDALDDEAELLLGAGLELLGEEGLLHVACAVAALGALGEQHAFAIVARLKDPVADVRYAAMAAIPQLGSVGYQFAGDIAECLEDSDADGRIAALQTLIQPY